MCQNLLGSEGKKTSRLLILACAVLEREIGRFQNGCLEVKFFDYGLHRTPENMSRALQVEIDQACEKDYDAIVLGYGLCSNGVVGIEARNIPLYIPRVHDCIALFLGSIESYRLESSTHPGTYYLTPGWIEKGETPLSKYESYAQSYDEETARWVIHEEMKNYTRIAFIDTGVSPTEPYRKVALKNAEFLDISYQELQGSPRFFKELVCGPRERNFLLVESNHRILQERFLDL